MWAKPPKIAIPGYSGRGQPPSRFAYGSQKPTNVRRIALQAKGWKKIRWREGSQGWLEEKKEPTKYFLCDLPKTYTLRRLVRLAKARWKIGQDYQQLKEELGLDHYEGRNWAGWHHHVTLVMLAQAFLTLETLRYKKNFWVNPATDTP